MQATPKPSRFDRQTIRMGTRRYQAMLVDEEADKAHKNYQKEPSLITALAWLMAEAEYLKSINYPNPRFRKAIRAGNTIKAITDIAMQLYTKRHNSFIVIRPAAS